VTLAVALLPGRVSGNKGYDKVENPTGLFKGYCVPLEFDITRGICEGNTRLGASAPRVCAASTDGVNPLAAMSWYNNEVENQFAPHTDKNLVFGDKSFQKLVQYFNSWACKQLGGDDAEQRGDLTDLESQEMACNFVWRRDQEIQKDGAPNPGADWGEFFYLPPGKNETAFLFRGVPKNQCSFDYDCREFNDPRLVYTCCDYCEYYFNKFCNVDPELVYRFCMEKVHCVCNSVKKGCYKPKKERGVTPTFPEGRVYPLHGAPCSAAARPAASISGLLLAAGVTLLAAVWRA